MAKNTELLCDESGYRLSAPEVVVCSECGTPRGGRRFTQLSPARIEALARGALFLRCSGLALLAVVAGFLAGVVGTLVLGSCRSNSQVALMRAIECFGESVVSIGIVAVFGGLASWFGLHCLGLAWVGRATHGASVGRDVAVGDAARNALRSLIVVVVIVVPLHLWNPEVTSRPLAWTVGLAESLVLTIQLVLQARLRALWERRTVGAWKPVWPTPLACLMCAALLIAAPSMSVELVGPSTLGVFLIGNAIELGRFDRVGLVSPSLSKVGPR